MPGCFKKKKLNTKFREWRLVGVNVQNIVKRHSWACDYPPPLWNMAKRHSWPVTTRGSVGTLSSVTAGL